MRAAQAARAPSAALRLPPLPGQHAMTHTAALQTSHAAANARRRLANGGAATGGACRQHRRRTVAAAVSREQLALLEQPVRLGEKL